MLKRIKHYIFQAISFIFVIYGYKSIFVFWMVFPMMLKVYVAIYKARFHEEDYTPKVS